MILDYHAKQKMVRALCADVGLNLVLHDEQSAYTDGRTLTVPRPSPDYTKEQYILWEYMVLHETGHNYGDMRDIFTLMHDKNVNMKSLYGSVLNILDDHRQEFYSTGTYEGKDAIMADGRAEFLTSQLTDTQPPEGDAEVMNAIYVWDSVMRMDFQQQVGSPALKMVDSLDGRSRELFLKMMDSEERFVPRDINAEEEWQLVHDIFEYLELDADEEEEKATCDPEKGDEDEGEGGDGDESDEEGDDLGKYLFHRHASPEDGEPADYPSAHEPDDSSTYEMGTVRVVDWRRTITPAGIGFYGEDSYGMAADTRRIIEGIGGSGGGLANTVRKIMQVRSQAHYQQGLKKGKLGRNLHRACMKGVGGYGQRVFKKRVENNVLDTSVMLLIDMSGSMGREKYTHAAKAALLLNEAIGKVGMPLEIVGFTENDDGPVHFLFKSWNDRISIHHMTDAFAAGQCELRENADGESILWAYNRLLQQPTKRKLLITLSDGAPAGTKHGISGFTSRVSQSLTKDGRVELYGIGIMDSSVSRYYPEYTVLKDASQLETALLNVIKRKILL